MMENDLLYKKRIKLVIFDLAGTTIDFGSCAPVDAIKKLFAQHNIGFTSQQIRRDMGINKRDHLQKLIEMGNFKSHWQKVKSRAFEESDLDQLYDRFKKILKSLLASDTRLIPGVLEIQDYLRTHNIMIATTTGYSREMSHIALHQACQQGFEPDINICNCDVPKGRPAPWMAVMATQRLGIQSPEQVIKVGDTLVDIKAGRNAGMWSIGVARTGNLMGLNLPEEVKLSEQERNKRLEEINNTFLKNEAHYAMKDITELPAIIELINHRLAAGEKPSISSLVEKQYQMVKQPVMATA
jgi:phosphonoacetaldehyde hydrolase